MQFALLALSSFGLGALHALEPGHGKTVVGAYLIGSKGRVMDAVLLGVVVTLTHSGSVVLLGAISTVAAAYFVPDAVQRVLGVVSGLLVLGVGLWLLRARAGRSRSHSHPHAHAHDHGGHSHVHGHAGHEHAAASTPAAGERPTFGQLLALGMAGGIVPCPGALAVLLAAVSYGQFARGLSLVVVFSAGMAAVLVAVGVAMVKAAGFAARHMEESRWTHRVPVASAAVITLVGLGLTIKAALAVL
ncbi:MAG: sulfite exporter TauE/SafE family protein [Armatimonadetes bacterium]|nr:sulfite exporter TauE/SafE family protein [Armatimonadota bacterium]